MGGHDYWDFGLGAGLMWIFWILLIVFVAVIIKSSIAGWGNRDGKQPSALEILKQRYARGEIDQDEYDRKRKDLVQ